MLSRDNQVVHRADMDDLAPGAGDFPVDPLALESPYRFTGAEELPLRLMSITRCHCCKVISSKGALGCIPELLIKISIRPSSTIMRVNMLRTSSSLETSAWKSTALPPAWLNPG
jgi:hypothetical protein